MERQDDLKTARKAADRFLKVRSRSVLEVRQKLASKGFSKAVTDSAIGELIECGLLDDREFARNWAESRVLSKKSGMKKIANELAQKGITRDIIAETEEYLKTKYDETETLQELLQRKFRGNAAVQDRDKLVNFLVRNGYTYSMADQAAREILKKNDR